MYVDINTGCVYNSYDSYTKNKKEINFNIKSWLLSSGKFELYCLKQKALFFKFCSNEYGIEWNTAYQPYLDLDLGLNEYQLKCCKQLFDNRRAKISRLKKKLSYIINNYQCLFLTLTFTDEILASTSADTRRRYISRFLKSLNIPFYVANIDFGDREKNPNSNEREHYHAIVQTEFIDLSIYPYGFIFAEQITKSDKSVKKIAKYINKLSYHAFKDSTKQSRLIFSKQTKCLTNEQISCNIELSEVDEYDPFFNDVEQIKMS